MFGSRKLRMRDAPPLVAAAGRAPTAADDRGGVALGAPPRPLDGPGAGGELRRPAHPRATARGARRAARADRRRDPDASTSAPSSSPATASATRSRGRCAAQAERGVKVRAADRRHRRLARRPSRHRRRCAAAGVEVVKFVPPFRSILRGRANLRNHRKMLVADAERLWCGGRNFAAEYFEGDPASRRRRSQPPGTTSASTCAASSSSTPASCSRKTGTMRRRTAGAAPRARADDGRRRERRAARPARAERPGAGRRHGAVAARLGLLHGAAAHPRGHAVLHSRCDPADGADPGGAPRRADRPRPAAPLEPPSRRRRPPPAAARPRRAPARALWFEPYMLHAKAVVIDDSSRWSARPTSTCAASSSTTS